MEWDQDTSLARYERVTQINTTVCLENVWMCIAYTVHWDCYAQFITE